MRYDGDFQVGIHGSGALMQDIPKVIENWVKTLPENYINREVKSEADYISSMLRERLKTIPNTEKEAVLKWDHFPILLWWFWTLSIRLPRRIHSWKSLLEWRSHFL